MQRNLSKVMLVVELDDGTRDTIIHGFLDNPVVPIVARPRDDRQRENFAIRLGETLKHDFIRYMYDVVWAE